MNRICMAGLAGLFGFGMSAGTLALPARADDLPWDQAQQFGAVSVRDRPRDGYQPQGVRIGNYVMIPEVGFRTTFTDDSQPRPNGKRRDVQGEVSAGVEFRSQLPRHMLDVRASGRATVRDDGADMDAIDGKIRVIGRLDINHAMSLFGDVSTELQHDDDVDNDRPRGAREPVAVAITRAEAGFRYSAGRIDAAIGARYTSYDYRDAMANDGSVIDQDARDVRQLEPFLMLGARLSPGYRVFTEVSALRQDNRGDGVIDRDAEGWKALAGVDLELSPLVRLSLKGGYMNRDYLQPGLVDISTYIYQGDLQWLVTPLVTLTFGTRRHVDATTFGLASGRVSTDYTVRADYEMWRNLIVSAEGSHRLIDYIGESRLDTAWVGRIGLEYMANRNWLFTLGYEHQRLESNVGGFDREFDKITFGAKYRY